MSLNELRDEIHTVACEKGWWDEPRSPLDCHMLMVSEIAEATECVRENKPYEYRNEDGKPEGEAVELIDAVIRILDYAGHMKWDVDRMMREKIEYNKTRPYRHGGKSK